jgi:tyrosyl-tRNA synthetase
MLLRLLCAADTPAADAAPLVLDNHAWLGELRVTELLTGAGRHMRMGAMLGKENVRSRLAPGGAGLSFAEFAYPLLQGYDWLHLARAHHCRVQVGGSDQWGNLVDGSARIARPLWAIVS